MSSSSASAFRGSSLSGLGAIETKKTGEYVTDKKTEQLIVELVIYLPVAFNRVDYILLVTFLNVSNVFLQRKKNQMECETSSDGLAPGTNL